MTEKRITIATADEQIRQLYETAFPQNEQIPWDDLMRLVGEMPLDFTAYYDREVMEQREQSQACLNSAELRENSAEGQTFIGFTIVYQRKSTWSMPTESESVNKYDYNSLYQTHAEKKYFQVQYDLQFRSDMLQYG